MGCFAWVVFGLLAGFLAKLVMPGKDKGGLVMTLILGVCGAMLGGYLGTLAGFGNTSEFSLRSLLLAVAGSLILLMIYRIFTGKRGKAKK